MNFLAIPPVSAVHRARLGERDLPPTLIEVTAQGSAVVFYGEQPFAEFRTLDAALRHHRMTADDLEDAD